MKFTIIAIFSACFSNVRFVQVIVQSISKTLNLARLKLYLLNTNSIFLCPSPQPLATTSL
jgi:hypothetical protein